MAFGDLCLPRAIVIFAILALGIITPIHAEQPSLFYKMTLIRNSTGVWNDYPLLVQGGGSYPLQTEGGYVARLISRDDVVLYTMPFDIPLQSGQNSQVVLKLPFSGLAKDIVIYDENNTELLRAEVWQYWEGHPGEVIPYDSLGSTSNETPPSGGLGNENAGASSSSIFLVVIVVLLAAFYFWTKRRKK